MRLLASALLMVAISACDACGAPPDTPDGGGEPEPEAGIPCRFNSDCPERSTCGDEGFCIDGLPDGQCLDETDCEGEDICVFPDGSDVGACVNPHTCDDASDCLEGQECVENDEGYRDCIYVGCESDEECVAEVGADCTQNEEAKCIARACQCRDLCGADCGDGRQCCAPLDDAPMCIDDPGACSKTTCDPGFTGVTDDPGEWSARACDFDTAVCACAELPPLPVGRVGLPHQLLHIPPAMGETEGRYVVVAYNATYGDLVIGDVVDGEVQQWRPIAGVPAPSDDTPIVAGPSGPRGGVEAPGDDVGSHLSAVVHPTTNDVHILALDATHQTLLHFVGSADGPFTSRVVEDQFAPGHFPMLQVQGNDRAVYAHVSGGNDGGTSVLNVTAASDFTADPSTFFRYEVKTEARADAHCSGGCADDEVCAAATVEGGIDACVPAADDCSCMSGEVCTDGGCRVAGTEAKFGAAAATDAVSILPSGAGAVLFVHDTRGGSLNLVTTGGNLYDGTATFAESVLDENDGVNLGRNLRATALLTGGYAVVSASDQRQVWMHELTDTLTLDTTTLLDDGERRAGENGPIDQHAVDAPVIAANILGDGVALIGWQDGTVGGVYGRSYDPSLGVDGWGPAQPVAGGPFSPAYEGTYGIGMSVAADGSALSSQRIRLAEDPAEFTVVMPGALLSCPADDAGEDDDDVATANDFNGGGHFRGIICADDVDVFDLGTVNAGCTVAAELLFKDEGGDLDLFLYSHGDQSTALDEGFSSSDNEFVVHEITGTGSYNLSVKGFSGGENAYVLRATVDCGG